MKTKLHKSLFLFILVLFAIQVQGQAFTGEDNIYKIKVQGEDLYLTLPDDDPITSGSQRLSYQPLDNTTNRQVFAIQAVAGETNKFTITSVITGKGVVEIEDSTVTNPFIACKGNTAGVAEMLDWWNPTRGAGTQLFSENDSPDYDGVAKRRLQDTTGGALAGTDCKLSGGSPLALDFVVTTPLSTKEFDISSVSITNPVTNDLIIKGLTSDVKGIFIYTILGKKVLSASVNTQDEINLDISSLSTGLYIVEMKGENSKFAKKIIKQ